MLVVIVSFRSIGTGKLADGEINAWGIPDYLTGKPLKTLQTKTLANYNPVSLKKSYCSQLKCNFSW